MIPKQLQGFIRQLYEATEDGSVHWEHYARDTFTCDKNGFLLHLSSYFDVDREQSSYTMTIKRPMEGSFSEKFNEAWFSVTDAEADFTTMRNLHESASVQSARLSEVLSGFFSRNNSS